MSRQGRAIQKSRPRHTYKHTQETWPTFNAIIRTVVAQLYIIQKQSGALYSILQMRIVMVVEDMLYRQLLLQMQCGLEL